MTTPAPALSGLLALKMGTSFLAYFEFGDLGGECLFKGCSFSVRLRLPGSRRGRLALQYISGSLYYLLRHVVKPVHHPCSHVKLTTRVQQVRTASVEELALLRWSGKGVLCQVRRNLIHLRVAVRYTLIFIG